MIFWRVHKLPNLNPRVVGDIAYPNRMAKSNAPLNVGGVTEITVNVAGTGYSVGEQLTIAAPPPGGIQAKAEIETVDSGGEILTVKITNPGAGYTVAPTPTITSPGVGGTFNVAVISAIVPANYGRIYSTDNFGKLINPPTAASVVDFTNGILQAQATTVTGDGNTRVQVVTAPTRITLKAEAGLKKNDKVDLAVIDATTPDQEKVQKGSNTFSTGYVGKIFEIETKNADGSVKEVTVDDDLVQVDMGVAQ